MYIKNIASLINFKHSHYWAKKLENSDKIYEIAVYKSNSEAHSNQNLLTYNKWWNIKVKFYNLNFPNVINKENINCPFKI